MHTVKRIMSICLVCAMLLGISAPSGFAGYESGISFRSVASARESGLSPETTSITPQASGDCGDTLTWVLESDGTLIISGQGKMDDYNFEGVQTPWYLHSDSIVSVVIEDGVTSIGAWAFRGCFYLEEVLFSESITKIGEEAFEGCISLKQVILPEGLQTLGNRCFGECLLLQYVSIPSTCNNYAEAFRDCWSLETIVNHSRQFVALAPSCGKFKCFPDLLTAQQYAFLMAGINKITGDASETEIQNLIAIFNQEFNTAFTEADIANLLSTYGDTDVYGGPPSYLKIFCPEDSLEHEFCESASAKHYLLGETDLHDCLNQNGTAGALTWEYEPGTKSLTFSGNGSIPDYAYNINASYDYDNSNNNIELTYAGKPCLWIDCEKLCFAPDSNVTRIGENAFADLCSLTEITVPAGVTTIANNAFAACFSLTDVYYEGSEEQWNAISIGSANEPLYNAEIHFNEQSDDPEALSPSFELCSTAEPDENGMITVDIYLNSCVGLTAFNLYINYDPAVLQFSSCSQGSDALLVQQLHGFEHDFDCNNISIQCNDTGTQIRLGGYFQEGLYNTEHFAEIFGAGSIDGSRFHAASLYFTVADFTANAQIDATAIYDFEGFFCDGFVYPAQGMMHNITADMDIAIHCMHIGETEVRDEITATCTLPGYTGDTYCLVCAAMIEKGEIAAPLPHTLDDGFITKAATCCSVGEKKYTCTECGAVETTTLVINPENHEGETTFSGILQATCGNNGYSGDTQCLGCNTIIITGSVIPATGNHTWDEGVLTSEPTYTTPGIKTYTCTVCGNTKTENTDKLEAEFRDDDEQALVDADGDIVALYGTSVAEYLDQASEGTIIIDVNGNALDSDAVPGTGSKLILPDGQQFDIIVPGDIYGDGNILANDARTTLRASVGLTTLNEVQDKAADTDNDKKITAYDARLILRASVGLEDPADWIKNVK